MRWMRNLNEYNSNNETRKKKLMMNFFLKKKKKTERNSNIDFKWWLHSNFDFSEKQKKKKKKRKRKETIKSPNLYSFLSFQNLHLKRTNKQKWMKGVFFFKKKKKNVSLFIDLDFQPPTMLNHTSTTKHPICPLIRCPNTVYSNCRISCDTWPPPPKQCCRSTETHQ